MKGDDDITDTLASDSHKLDAVDLITGPITANITGVDIYRNDKDFPVHVHLDAWAVPFKPGLTMRRLISAVWGPKKSDWIGKSLVLYCDPSVKFGKDTPGGVRISAMSHIPKAKSVTLPISRGRSAPFNVMPLEVAAASYPQEMFEANLQAWSELIEGGKMTAAQVVAKAGDRAQLTEEQKKIINSIGVKNGN